MSRVSSLLAKKNRPLVGTAAFYYHPEFVEIAGHAGLDVIWIDTEHTQMSWTEVSNMCRAAAGAGLLTMIRVPDSQRQNVLRAAEIGPDILDLPMGNTPEVVKEFVDHARPSPQGNRGFLPLSRAHGYGVKGTFADRTAQLNNDLCLLSQVETVEAVSNFDALCGIDNLDGFFFGAGDLAVSMGLNGDNKHPEVLSEVRRLVRLSKERGKITSLYCNLPDLKGWMSEGVDLIFCDNDVDMAVRASKAIAEVSEGLKQPSLKQEY